MTHKEFYFWLEGYLQGRLENEHISITPIVEKMSYVKEEVEFDLEKFKHLGNRPKPLTIQKLQDDTDT
jgi:hypothetical protein